MDTWPSEHVWHSTRVQKLDAHACVCARSSCHRCMKHASAILFANLTLRSVHPHHAPRILAGEHPAGTRGGRRRAVSGDAREGTPQLRLFSLLIIYSQFRKLQDPTIKTQMRSRSRRVQAGRFKIPIFKKCVEVQYSKIPI